MSKMLLFLPLFLVLGVVFSKIERVWHGLDWCLGFQAMGHHSVYLHPFFPSFFFFSFSSFLTPCYFPCSTEPERIPNTGANYGEATTAAAANLDETINTLVKNFGEGSDYFKVRLSFFCLFASLLVALSLFLFCALFNFWWWEQSVARRVLFAVFVPPSLCFPVDSQYT